jgi:hypothetical protein
MTLNVAKCGAVGFFPEESIAVYGQPIPKVLEYKYLGVEHASNGLAWELFTDRTARRAKGILGELEDVRAEWPPAIRRNLYITFVRPILEYATPLRFSWYQLDTTRRKGIWDPLVAVQERAARWILGTKNNPQLLQSIVGLDEVIERAHDLTAAATANLATIDKDNPLEPLLRNERLNEITNYATILTRKWSRNERWALFQRDARWITTRGEHQRELLHTYLHRKRLERMAQSGKTMGTYIRSPARHPKSLIDMCVLIDKSEIRRLALQWRLNLLNRTKCRCGAQLTRGHVLRCRESPSWRPDHPAWQILTEHQARMETSPDTLTPLPGPTYSLGDVLLNNGYAEDFFEWWLWMTGGRM